LWAAGIFIFAAFYLARFGNSLATWDYLKEILPLTPLYLAVSGLIFGFSGLAAAWGLWAGRAWGRRFFWLVFLVFIGYFWLDRLFWPGSLQRQINSGFVLAVQILVGLLSYYLFSRQKVNLFFGVCHERKSENSETS
jgi:hypothetical protein